MKSFLRSPPLHFSAAVSGKQNLIKALGLTGFSFRRKNVNSVYIAASVLKRREQKTALGLSRFIVPAHRAHCADQEPVDLLGFSQTFFIAGFERHVVAAMEKIDRIAAERLIFTPKLLIKYVQHGVIFQPALS